jgi:hypothetical protein
VEALYTRDCYSHYDPQTAKRWSEEEPQAVDLGAEDAYAAMQTAWLIRVSDGDCPGRGYCEMFVRFSHVEYVWVAADAADEFVDIALHYAQNVGVPLMRVCPYARIWRDPSVAISERGERSLSPIIMHDDPSPEPVTAVYIVEELSHGVWQEVGGYTTRADARVDMAQHRRGCYSRYIQRLTVRYFTAAH